MSIQRVIFLLFSLFSILLSIPFSVQTLAQENLTSNFRMPFEAIKSGSLYFKTPTGYVYAITQDSDYQVEVNGLLARVNFTQTFKNTSNQPLEAVYVFPLIDDAAVDSMVMDVGERRIIGKIKEKQQAKKLYQQAKQQGKKASLVSQQRPNMFTSKVSHIAPGETITITMSYLQSITYHDDEFSLRIPLTITPRYTPEYISHDDNKVKDKMSNISNINNAGWANVTPPQTRQSNGQRVNIAVKLNTGLSITNIVSRYHQIVKQNSDEITQVSLANNRVAMDRDFVLSWQVAQGNSPKAALFQKSDEGYNYGLFMVMPPAATLGKVIAKDVMYIVDTSGSMGGVAINQAKQALMTALDLLNPNDTFNIIAFNNKAHQWFTRNLTANASNIALAKDNIMQMTAGGGTNMYPAIEKALQVNDKASEEQYRQVVFITDGAIADEQTLFSLIDNKLGNTRLHTIGIGSSPNSYFMSRAAELGRGTYRYIGNINEVSQQMQQLFAEISQPVMKDIQLSWPVDNVEYYPSLIPDLYQHQPLVISARWPKGAKKNTTNIIDVKGRLADKNWHHQLSITADKSKGESINQASLGIDQWWARQKIKHLTRQHSRSDEQAKSLLQQQITQLALKHHLISAYTSFIAVEEKVTRHKTAKINPNTIANLMPKGSTQAIPLANTALGLMGYVYSGIILLLLSFLFLRYQLTDQTHV